MINAVHWSKGNRTKKEKILLPITKIHIIKRVPNLNNRIHTIQSINLIDLILSIRNMISK